MFRLVCSLCVVGLFATGLPAADEAVELKEYKSKVGDRVRVTEDEQTTTRSIFINDDKREEKTEKQTRVVIYVAETLEVKAGEKKAIKGKRVYEKAEEVKNGKLTQLPLHGKTVIIEKKDDKYTFTYADGKAVEGKARETLDKEYNKKDEDDYDDFIPKRPLKPGESWKMDTEKLLKAFTKEADSFVVDKKTASGSGKLLESYSFGGRKYGVYDIRIEFPLTELGGPNKVALKPGSKMAIQMFGDGNVDGTEPDGMLTTRMTLRVAFEANGVEGHIKADGISVHLTEKLPPPKRD
jgi:hypothetical protein